MSLVCLELMQPEEMLSTAQNHEPGPSQVVELSGVLCRKQGFLARPEACTCHTDTPSDSVEFNFGIFVGPLILRKSEEMLGN